MLNLCEDACRTGSRIRESLLLLLASIALGVPSCGIQSTDTVVDSWDHAPASSDGTDCQTCRLDVPCVPDTLTECSSCEPICVGHDCGDDGCGGSCGTCSLDQSCVEGKCQESPDCWNGIGDESESDLDCGGTCPKKCLYGQVCRRTSDCRTTLCREGLCSSPEQCFNEHIDGEESDVDCGGTDCPGCSIGKYCRTHSDCQSEACIYGICAPPSCSDHVRNGNETDVDCGGACPKCTNDRKCKMPGDCELGGCERGRCCLANPCGQCGDVPSENCNGIDDDCDGLTDEDVGEGPLCPLQKGVCAGTHAECKAGEWICDDSTYRSYNPLFEGLEQLCDGIDNDCNGLIDDARVCCTSNCFNRECGDDGCYGSCGDCPPAEACIDGFCKLTCGADPIWTCDGRCGRALTDLGCSCDSASCEEDPIRCCTDFRVCCCTPDCKDKECGSDGCGGRCGSCPDGAYCDNGRCCCRSS